MRRVSDIRHEDGQSLIEFVLVLPVLLLLATGILEFGLMFNQYLSLTDAARTGARALALDAGQSGDVCSAEEQKLMGPANPTLNLTQANFVSPNNGPDPIFQGTEQCNDAGSWTPGDSVTFYIQKDFQFDHLFGFVPFKVTLTAQATDAIEGQ
jgi:TadE-like protein